MADQTKKRTEKKQLNETGGAYEQNAVNLRRILSKTDICSETDVCYFIKKKQKGCRKYDFVAVKV